jgi:FixJ family two-component response regulator
MTVKRSLVAIVDDDESVRESLPYLLRSFGFQAQPFASAGAFLDSEYLADTACLILDVAMPGMSGPELQAELTRRGSDIAVVFITAQTDEGVRERALRGGAVAYLLKPFSEASIVGAVTAAMAKA